MPTYRAVNQDTHEVVEYDEAAPRPEHLAPPWRVAEIVVPPPPDDPPPAPPYDGSWKITKLAFLNRFQDAEWVAFDLLAIDTPSGPPAQRQQQSALRLFMKKVELASFIDLQRADTRAGVQALEAIGVLAAGRAAVILDTAPTDEELYRG